MYWYVYERQREKLSRPCMISEFIFTNLHLRLCNRVLSEYYICIIYICVCHIVFLVGYFFFASVSDTSLIEIYTLNGETKKIRVGSQQFLM